MLKRAWLASAILIMAGGWLAGCAKNNPMAPSQAPAQGKMMFALDAASDNIVSGKVAITKGNLTQVLPITITGYTGTVTFNGLQVGHWNIQVQLFDTQGVEIYSGAGDALVTKNQTTSVAIKVKRNTGDLLITVQVPGLLLWNKLGSDAEVQNSVFGPNGVISGGVSYANVEFDNGVINNDGNSYVSFDASGFDGNRATVEFWFKTEFNVVNGVAQGTTGVQKFLVAQNEYSPSLGNGGAFFVFFDDSYHNNQLKVYLAGTGPDGIVLAPTVSWSAQEAHHLAVVFDKNAGFSGNKTLAVFLDGVEVASSNAARNDYNKGTCPVTVCNELYSVVNHTLSYTVIDNLKIWNYPKTDFSDRFAE